MNPHHLKYDNRRSVLINFSGGKDSTVAVLETLKQYPKDEITLCFQDTGAEYLETKPHVEKMAKLFDLPLVILTPARDWWQQVEDYGYFPTPSCRMCTQNLKTNLTNKWIKDNRQRFGNELIVVFGMRAEESARRSKLNEREIHPTTLKYNTFKAESWYPCLEIKESEIYERIAAEGLPLHPMYAKAGGIARRISCWCCFYGVPEVARDYTALHKQLADRLIALEESVHRPYSLKGSFSNLISHKQFALW